MIRQSIAARYDVIMFYPSNCWNEFELLKDRVFKGMKITCLRSGIHCTIGKTRQWHLFIFLKMLCFLQRLCGFFNCSENISIGLNTTQHLWF